MKNYEIVLLHGEILKVDFFEAYETYKAVCIRNRVLYMTQGDFFQKKAVAVDQIIFNNMGKKVEELNQNK